MSAPHFTPIRAEKKPGARSSGLSNFTPLAKENGFVILAFCATALLTLFVWFCFQMIPFGTVPDEFKEGITLLGRLQHGRTILRMDAFHQYGPLFGEYAERLAHGRSLLYSWDSGLGGGFLGNLFNYLSSPFGLLVLLFGHSRVPEAVGVMILLKAATASGAFAYMLKKMYSRNDASIAAFGVLYSFCGFFIAYYWNVMWIDAMALLPLVALGIDYIIKKQKFMLYTASLALTLVSNYYMGFMVCIFSVLFFLLRFFIYDYKAPLEHRAARRDKKDSPWIRMFGSGASFALGSLLAGALAAFALLPVFFALRSSSATSGDFPDSKEWFRSAFKIFDFLANHLADVAPTIRSSGDNVLPNVYCGAATLLLLPLYLFVPSIKPREKALHAVMAALLFFSFNTRVLNYIWHGNHFPNDLPYRFSFIYSFVLLLIAFRTFQHIRELSGKLILGAGLGMSLFVVLAQQLGSKNLTGGDRAADDADLAVYINIGFAVVYTLLFFAMRRAPEAPAHARTKSKATALSLLLLCAVVTEVCAADTNNFEISQQKYPFVYDLAGFQEAKARLLEKDKGFYRMELTDARTRMDPAWFDYPGISTFSSMAYEKTANLEYRLGLGGNFINSYTYNPQTPVYNAMHSLKYLLETQGSDQLLRTYAGQAYGGSSYLKAMDSPYYTRLFSQHRFTVFENNYWLPVGYFAKDGLRRWQTDTNPNPFELQAAYWELASGAANVFLPLAYTAPYDYDSDYPYVTTEADSQYVNYSNASSLLNKGRRIPLDIVAEEPGNAYIHVASSNVSAVYVYRGDGSVEERSHDDRCIWDLGVVQPEEPLRVELKLESKAPESGGFSCYIYTMNDVAFSEGYTFFNDHGWRIADGDHSDTRLSGTISTPPDEDGLLYTSIPFDTGWQVTVDGKRVRTEDYVAVGDGAFLAIPLLAGDHEVTFRFVPPGLRGGLMISGAALILLGLLGFLMEARKRRHAEDAEPPSGDAWLAEPPASYIPTGSIISDYPTPPETQAMFGTSGLRPEDFSLHTPAEPPPATEERFHLTLPDPDAFMEEAQPEEPSVDAAQPPEPLSDDLSEDAAQPTEQPTSAPNIQAILQELQERAAALQERVGTYDDGDGDG